MINQESGKQLWLMGGIAALAAIVFMLDTVTPRGYSVWALYLVPLLLSAWLPYRRSPFLLASIFTTLVVVRFFLPSTAVTMWVSTTNRAFGILVMWTIAILLVMRKKTEGALQESEARFRQMAETIQEVFWMAKPSATETLYVSPAYERIWARSRESLLANPTNGLGAIHPEDRERTVAALACYRDGEAEVEYRIVRPDGSVRWIWDHGYPVRNAHGEVSGIVGFAMDITERKSAERALEEQTRLMRAILESVGDGVIVTDRNGKFVIFNRQAMEQYGDVPAADIPPHQWATYYGLYLPDQKTLYPANALPLARAMRGEAVDNAEVFVRTAKHPEGRWALVTGRPVLDEQGTLLGGVIVRRDMTERKRVEEEREQLVQQLREALENVKTLKGLLALCSSCQRVRDERGAWKDLATYVRAHTEANFSHSLCPTCGEVLFPDFYRQRSANTH